MLAIDGHREAHQISGTGDPAPVDVQGLHIERAVRERDVSLPPKNGFAQAELGRSVVEDLPRRTVFATGPAEAHVTDAGRSQHVVANILGVGLPGCALNDAAELVETEVR